MQGEVKQRQENVLAGLVGAFLGSLLGVACIVIVGQLGYVTAISGLVMAVCSIKGYELLGGRISRKGAVIACLLTILMTYIGNKLDFAIATAQYFEVDIFTAFRAVDDLLEEEILNVSAYWSNLGMLYLFTLIGAVPTLVNVFRSAKSTQEPLQGAPVYPQGNAYMPQNPTYSQGNSYTPTIPLPRTRTTGSEVPEKADHVKICARRTYSKRHPAKRNAGCLFLFPLPAVFCSGHAIRPFYVYAVFLSFFTTRYSAAEITMHRAPITAAQMNTLLYPALPAAPSSQLPTRVNINTSGR